MQKSMWTQAIKQQPGMRYRQQCNRSSATGLWFIVLACLLPSPPRHLYCSCLKGNCLLKDLFSFQVCCFNSTSSGRNFHAWSNYCTQQLSLRYVRWIFNVKQMYSPFLASACDEKSNPANFEINFSLSFCSGFGNDSYTKFLVQKNPRSANCLANKCDTANKVCSAGSCRLVWVKDEWCRIGSERIPYRETQP